MRTFSKLIEGRITPATKEAFVKRISGPGVRQAFAKSYEELAYQIRRADPDEPNIGLYGAIITNACIGLFGRKAQAVDLDKAFNFTEDDLDVLEKIRAAEIALRQGGPEEAKEKLGQVPIPCGSECDRGQFDSYTQEIIIGAGLACPNLIDKISRRQSRHPITRLLPEFPSNADILGVLYNGYRRSDREQIYKAILAAYQK